jgi:hypothetical protein
VGANATIAGSKRVLKRTTATPVAMGLVDGSGSKDAAAGKPCSYKNRNNQPLSIVEDLSLGIIGRLL